MSSVYSNSPFFRRSAGLRYGASSYGVGGALVRPTTGRLAPSGLIHGEVLGSSAPDPWSFAPSIRRYGESGLLSGSYLGGDPRYEGADQWSRPMTVGRARAVATSAYATRAAAQTRAVETIVARRALQSGIPAAGVVGGRVAATPGMLRTVFASGLWRYGVRLTLGLPMAVAADLAMSLLARVAAELLGRSLGLGKVRFQPLDPGYGWQLLNQWDGKIRDNGDKLYGGLNRYHHSTGVASPSPSFVAGARTRSVDGTITGATKSAAGWTTVTAGNQLTQGDRGLVVSWFCYEYIYFRPYAKRGTPSVLVRQPELVGLPEPSPLAPGGFASPDPLSHPDPDGPPLPPRNNPPYRVRTAPPGGGHKYQPPSGGRKERKATIRNQGILSALLGVAETVSEAVDIIDALYEALPASVKQAIYRELGRQPNPVERVRALVEHFASIDVEQAVRNLIVNQVDDAIHGRIGSIADPIYDRTGQLTGVGRALGAGSRYAGSGSPADAALTWLGWS